MQHKTNKTNLLKISYTFSLGVMEMSVLFLEGRRIVVVLIHKNAMVESQINQNHLMSLEHYIANATVVFLSPRRVCNFYLTVR